jgi:hypothetical protein
MAMCAEDYVSLIVRCCVPGPATGSVYARPRDQGDNDDERSSTGNTPGVIWHGSFGSGGPSLDRSPGRSRLSAGYDPNRIEDRQSPRRTAL